MARPLPFYLHGLTFNDAPEGKDHLKCPACQSGFMHPVDVGVMPAGVEGLACTVTAQGVRLGRFTDESEGSQGASIGVTFQCRTGHETILFFSFQDGRTLVSTAVTQVVERKNAIWQGTNQSPRRRAKGAPTANRSSKSRRADQPS